MKVQNTLLLISVVILAFVLTGIVSADSHNVYCYDEDMEGFICFETLKVCEVEQKDDLTAESECYESQE